MTTATAMMFWLATFPLGLDHADAVKEVLILGVDGLWADALAAAETPNRSPSNFTHA